MMRQVFRSVTLRCLGVMTVLAFAVAVSPMIARPAAAMVSICAKSCDACPDRHGAMMSDCALCCVVGAVTPEAPKPMLPIIGVQREGALLALNGRTDRPVTPPPR